MLLPSLRDRADYVVRFLFGSFIAIGCFLVVWPFATAMSVAAVIATSLGLSLNESERKSEAGILLRH